MKADVELNIEGFLNLAKFWVDSVRKTAQLTPLFWGLKFMLREKLGRQLGW